MYLYFHAFIEKIQSRKFSQAVDSDGIYMSAQGGVQTGCLRATLSEKGGGTAGLLL